MRIFGCSLCDFQKLFGRNKNVQLLQDRVHHAEHVSFQKHVQQITETFVLRKLVVRDQKLFNVQVPKHALAGQGVLSQISTFLRM